MFKQLAKKWMRVAIVLAVSFGVVSVARAAEKGTQEITLINVKYQGKVLWLPGTIVANKGDMVKLTLINNVQDDPAVHGFHIPEYDVKVGVERGKPSQVEFKAKKAGLFKIKCHLHPAHLHSQLLVID